MTALLPLLEDDAVREPTIEALGKIGSAKALAALSTLVRETNDGVTFAACLRAIANLLAQSPDEALVMAGRHPMLRDMRSAAMDRDMDRVREQLQAMTQSARDMLRGPRMP